MNSLSDAIQLVEQTLNLNLSSTSTIQFIERTDIKGYEIIQSETISKIYYQNMNDAMSALGIWISNPKTEYHYKKDRSIEKVSLMLDTARMAVPKIETLKTYVVILSLLGYNALGLYLEDVFEIEKEPKFGYMRGRYTVEELKDLDDFAAKFDFEIIPYIQTLAHLASIFKHWDYHSIKDIDDILLVNEPKTYELIENMLKTTKKAFRSKEINIGMDEAWMLGLGRYLDKYGYQDRLSIMFEHLHKVNALCMKYDYQPSMWADMFFHLVAGNYFESNISFSEDIQKKIPNNLKLIYWDYYQTKRERYDQKFTALKQLTSNFGYAGGAWKWIGFAPNNDVTRRTMSLAIESAKAHQVKDFIVTGWGDNGGEASQFSILPSLVFLIQTIQGDDRIHVDNFLTLLTGHDEQNWLSLDKPNQLYENLPAIPVNPSKYLLYEDPFLGAPNMPLSPVYGQYYEKHVKALKKIKKEESPYQYIFDTLDKLCEVLKDKSTLSVRLKEAYEKKNIASLSDLSYKEIPNTIRKIEAFYQAFMLQWHKENKPFGFEHHSLRIGGLKQRLTDIANRLDDYIQGRVNDIPELKERIIELANDPYNGLRYLNTYSDLISFGKL